MSISIHKYLTLSLRVSIELFIFTVKSLTKLLDLGEITITLDLVDLLLVYLHCISH